MRVSVESQRLPAFYSVETAFLATASFAYLQMFLW